MRNVLDKHDEVLQSLREMYLAKPREQAQELKRAFIAPYGKEYPESVQSLNQAANQLFTYFDFPGGTGAQLLTMTPQADVEFSKKHNYSFDITSCCIRNWAIHLTKKWGPYISAELGIL